MGARAAFAVKLSPLFFYLARVCRPFGVLQFGVRGAVLVFKIVRLLMVGLKNTILMFFPLSIFACNEFWVLSTRPRIDKIKDWLKIINKCIFSINKSVRFNKLSIIYQLSSQSITSNSCNFTISRSSSSSPR